VESSRDRLLSQAMRLFGEQGYAGTSVAQIEAAAGLSPGAGGLYAHFRSKEALLRAGLEALLAPGGGPLAEPEGEQRDRPPVRSDEAAAVAEAALAEGAAPVDQIAPPSLTEELVAIAREGLARLRHDRDYNRVLVRDLRNLPDLLELSAEREIRPVHRRLAAFLAQPRLRCDRPEAVAAVLIGAVSHYWLLTDVFGAHPAGVSEDDYLTAAAELAAASLHPEEET